jgi:hypothetical protein
MNSNYVCHINTNRRNKMWPETATLAVRVQYVWEVPEKECVHTGKIPCPSGAPSTIS